ncbi:hypothetical protein [Actinoplanes sp. HUAS TT8]|uniref:hypothetical protein n=1 Tax=Actinoplanes sp. HUAS TT8 TaxID=3447453 RepID=UPI003F52661C
MRPSLINEIRVPGARDVGPAPGVGWIVTEPATSTVRLLDHDLRTAGRVPVPICLRAAASPSFVAVGDQQEVVVLDHAGGVRWRRSFGKSPRFHLDRDGVLWVHVAAAQQLLAVDAATGEEIDRRALAGPEFAWFIHRPAIARTGLVLLSPDPSPGVLIGLTGGRIDLRALRGDDLADLSPSGARYLTADTEGFFSIRDVATESVLVHRHLGDLPDLPPELADGQVDSWTLFLTEELVLVSLWSGDASEHLLLSAHSLRCRSRVRYPGGGAGSIVGGERPGRWLTRDRAGDLLRLWRLDGDLDDGPLPGQIALL